MTQDIRTDGVKAAPACAEQVITLPPGGGRHYAMGKLTALFKADEEDTQAAYSVSEWLLDPGQEGVGAHSHAANDEIFLVLEGSPEFLIGDTWSEQPEGSFLRIPHGVTHDFRNSSDRRARVFNVFIPRGFERNMPEIVAWFRDK